jgi:hypothetical protein
MNSSKFGWALGLYDYPTVAPSPKAFARFVFIVSEFLGNLGLLPSQHRYDTGLATRIRSFNVRCVAGLEANRERIADYVKHCLMLVTALNPKIGCDNAAKIAKTARKDGTSLREAALKLNLLSGAEFDEAVISERMT